MNKFLKLSLALTLSLSLFSCKKRTKRDNTNSTNQVKTKTVKTNNNNSSNTTKNNSTTSKHSDTYDKEDNFIYFGTYPQTLESNASKISEIEEKITAFDGPANAASKGWEKQTDYASNSTREAYYYRDIDLNSDGVNDYRAIHIYKYKNYNTSQAYDPTSLWYHDKETFVEGNTYYFKYEKIKWNILEEKDGKAYLYANLALDAYFYEKCSDEKADKYSHGGKSGYANNYELSSIRKWLNEDFYNLAFNTLEKAIINEATVNNGLSSTLDETNSYVCSNTTDNVYLLSEKEITTYYPTEESRTYDKSILSDYAKIQDADYYKVLLRTPYKSYAYEIKYVANEYSHGAIVSGYANYALYAIRPVIVITL